MGLLSKAISVQVVTGHSHGLLRRLTLYSRELDPAQVSVRLPGQGGAGGLLHKSLLFLHMQKEETHDNETLLIVDFTENIQRLLAKIEGLTKDFSYFPGLFSLLVTELRLPQSALFLCRASRDAFVPWLSRGLDTRLLGGLSFTERQWEEQNRSSRNAPFLLEDSRRFFPAVSGSLPRPLFMFPFAHQGALEGSLLVGNFNVHPDSRASLFRLFTSLSAKIGPAIASLMKGLNALPRPERIYRTPTEAVAADSCHILALPLEPLFESLAGPNALFDRTRLRDTIIYAVNCWLGDFGAAAAQGDTELLVVARGSRWYSPGLLSSFITWQIKDFFKGLFDRARPLVPAGAAECPADSSELPEAILARLRA
jgi:hypothetical protein